VEDYPRTIQEFEERFSTEEGCRAYLVWVVDPETPESVLYTAKGRVPVSDATLRVPGSAIEIPLRQLEEE